MVNKKEYKAGDIEVLEGLEPVRRRPGMYIGGTEGPDGLHHLVKEILDNSIDEAMNGHGDKITVLLSNDLKQVTVEDNGRGIPVDIHPKFRRSALELVLTTLHAGGKFSDDNYTSAGGLHGVGASVVNALSEKLEATVWRDGYEWWQSFSRGIATSKLLKKEKSKLHGTRILFSADKEIFRNVEFSPARIEKIVEEKAFLNRGLSIIFVNEASRERKEFCYEDGIQSFLRTLLAKEELQALGGETFFFEKSDGVKVEVAFCWSETPREEIHSYVNGINTKEGGSHEDGFKSGIVKAIRNFLTVHDRMPKGVKLGSEDMREGLLAVLSVNVPGAVSQLQFQGQTKDRLNNPEILAPVEALLRGFENTLNNNPSYANQLLERVTLAAKARQAARSAAEGVSRKVGVSHRLNLPGKLADCSATNPDKCELLIVEGDSAGGSAKQGRDRATQAVLPLRGKILNTVAASHEKLKENKELLDLVSALGCGSGEQIRLEKLRYDKVIIMTDADADGMHIASLLMAFFFRYLRPLIEAGHLYLAMAPLYRVRVGSGTKEETHWVFNDEEQSELLKKLGEKKQIHITRFKGLGEMNPKTLWETTLNPATRSLLRVTIDDGKAAEGMLDSLFGRDASERYNLIQANAHRLEADL
jgi:DNA gyrase/topoisomerase IV subunit B